MNDGGKADIGDNFVNVSGDLPQRTASVSTICVRVVCFSGLWGGVSGVPAPCRNPIVLTRRSHRWANDDAPFAVYRCS